MEPIQIVFATIMALLSFAGVVVPLWRNRGKSKAIRWGIMAHRSMMNIAKEIASDVEIRYKGRVLSDMRRYRFIIHNTGRSPIEGSDIVTPLRWVGRAGVLKAAVVVSDPRVDLSLEVQGSTVIMTWPVFNQSCKALIEVLCESDKEADVGELSYQIKGVPKIEERWIRSRISDQEDAVRLADAPSAVMPFISIGLLLRKRWVSATLYSLAMFNIAYLTDDIMHLPPYWHTVIAPCILAVWIAHYTSVDYTYEKLVRMAIEKR